MLTLFHGSSELFDHFDLSRVGEAIGVKFGFGVYLTESEASAVHYSVPRHGDARADHYLYTVEIPDLTEDNHLINARPVSTAIIEKVEKALGKEVPKQVMVAGKYFRKWIGCTLTEAKKPGFREEEAAAKFLNEHGVFYNVWPQAQSKPNGLKNIAVFSTEHIRIIRCEHIDVITNKQGKNILVEGSKKEVKVMQLHEAIAKYYPEYSDIKHYPAHQCAPIRSTREKWGALGNFYKTDIIINGVTFDCSERLFHMMKFRPDACEGIRSEYERPCGMGIKMHMRSLKKHHPEWLRSEEEWGAMVVDAMRFCLQAKYDQCKAFRDVLAQSKELFIVEDETARNARKHRSADSWGANLEGDEYVGLNLLGRLLMELRDKGKLDYSLPEDAFDFIQVVKS